MVRAAACPLVLIIAKIGDVIEETRRETEGTTDV